MRWLGVKSSAIPTARELLRLVYAGRMCLAIAIYVTTALKLRVAAPLDILVTSLVLVTAAAVTLASYWHTHFRRRIPGPTFLYLQALFDAILITAVVHMTGGAESDLASLYVILVAVTALLMPPANAGLVTLFAGLVYFADVFWGHQGTISAGVWIQLGVFMLVAMVMAYVASRVNVMGAEREALAAEVRQVQLEADDVLRNIRTGVLTVDADGRLLYANPASEDILGFKAREWLGRPVMPEFARLAPEFWAAVTSTARRGVRLMRVEATIDPIAPSRSASRPRPSTDRSALRPVCQRSSPISPTPSGWRSCTCARSDSRRLPSCRRASRTRSKTRWRPSGARWNSWVAPRAPIRMKSSSPT